MGRSSMSSLIEEWVAKAEGDFRTAGRELSVREAPNYDAVCFHAQQAIEKLMKALMISCGSVPPRSHDLVALAQLLEGVDPSCSWPAEELRFLNLAAVEFRYPGESAEQSEAEEAFAICTALRERLLLMIGARSKA